jgi:hypothetical protein
LLAPRLTARDSTMTAPARSEPSGGGRLPVS